MQNLEVLHAKRNLAGTRIRKDEGLSIKVHEKRSQLHPYLKDAKTQGNMVYFQKDKLVINGEIYNLVFLQGN
jgi:hypothetical protein